VMQSADPGTALRELREPTGIGHPAA
jgi:hypothetical protein